jgi:3-oxoacyl-[acyl-carrier-protein] synthase II
MNQPMAIRGIGIVGGFGAGKQSALQAIRQGTAPNSTMCIETNLGAIDYPVYRADAEPLKDFIPPAKLRRINPYSRIATLAACLALQDAGIEIPCSSLNLAVIVASGYGASSTTFQFLDDVIMQGDELASPTQFSNSVHSSAASHITILLQIQGPTLTVTQFEMSTVAAFLNAQLWLSEKRVDAVLLGGVDEINPVLLYCYHRFWPDTIPVKMKPLEYEYQTAIPGEGAAFLLLTRKEGSTAPYGYISNVSWQNTNNFTLPNDIGLVIPGADGHRACGLRYRRLLSDISQNRIQIFSQLVGSMPCGQMMDIAMASIAAQTDLIPHSFCSLKTDADDNIAVICHDK